MSAQKVPMESNGTIVETAKTRSEHEDITQRMMLLDRMDALLFGREHRFMEVDTPDEYTVLVEEMYPALTRRA